MNGMEGKTMKSFPWLRPAYPLVEAGIVKEGEREILARHQLGHVRKSGCVACHYQPDSWFWALRETEPELWAEVCAWEQAANEQNGKKSYRIRNARPIAEVVERWRARHPEATIDGVLDKDYGRGKPCASPEPLVAIAEPKPKPKPAAPAGSKHARALIAQWGSKMPF